MPFAPLPTPRTRAGALAVFLGGCAVIAATTLDVARRMRANDAPVAARDAAELAAYKAALDARAARRALGAGRTGDG
jgi:hypothetical protein